MTTFDPAEPTHRRYLVDALRDPHEWDLTQAAEALGCDPTKEAVGAAMLAYDEQQLTKAEQQLDEALSTCCACCGVAKAALARVEALAEKPDACYECGPVVAVDALHAVLAGREVSRG